MTHCLCRGREIFNLNTIIVRAENDTSGHPKNPTSAKCVCMFCIHAFVHVSWKHIRGKKILRSDLRYFLQPRLLFTELL